MQMVRNTEMEPILQALLTEGQAECKCDCGKASYVFFNTKIECKNCWFSSTTGNIGGPFNLLSELKKANADTPQIVVCPDISPKQEQIYEAVGLIVNLARVQHALTNLLGDNFTAENESIVPSYDLFEFLVFRNKESVGAVIAREMLRQWGVTFQITARAAAELFVKRPDLGRGLCVILGDIHTKLEMQRRGIQPGQQAPKTISQMYFSFMWEPQTYPVRFALVAGNAPAARALADNEKILIDKKALTAQQRLDLALATVVTFPWEPIALACAAFAQDGKALELDAAALEGLQPGVRDDRVSGAAVAAILKVVVKLKGKEEVRADPNRVLPHTGRPLLFFANCRPVAEALLEGGADATATDAEGRRVLEVVRNPGVIEALSGGDTPLADLSKTVDKGAAVLHSAVRDGNERLLRRLVKEANVDINLTVGELPALIFAQDAATVQVCLELGADLKQRHTSEGLSILHLAARLNKSEEVFKLLLSTLASEEKEVFGVDDRSLPAGMTPLMNARSIDTVKLLLSLGADPLAKDHEGAPTVCSLLAAGLEAEPLLPLLGEAAVKLGKFTSSSDALKEILNQTNADGQNSVYACSSSRQLKAVLEAGAEVVSFGAFHISPLAFFVFNNNGPCVAELLRTVGDMHGHARMQELLEQTDALGKTALMYATTPVVARLLQMQGANVNARCNEGLSVLGHLLAAGIHDENFDEATLVSLFATPSIMANAAAASGGALQQQQLETVVIHSPNWERLELSPPLTAELAASVAADERARMVAELESETELTPEERAQREAAIPTVDQVVAMALKADKVNVWRGNDLGLSESMLVSSASQVALLNRVGYDFHNDRSLTGATPLMAALSTGAASPAVREIINTLGVNREEMLKKPPQERRSMGVPNGGDELVLAHLNDVRTGPPRSKNGFSLHLLHYQPLVNLFNPIPAWRGTAWMFSQLPVHAAVRGMSAIMWARVPVDLATLHMIGADITAVTDDDSKLTLFHFLAANGGATIMREALRCLLSHFAKLQEEKKCGEPAEAAKAFLSRVDVRGFTCRDVAAAVDNAEVAALLERMGVPRGEAFTRKQQEEDEDE